MPFRRRQADSNRRSGFCRPVPYHLAMAPEVLPLVKGGFQFNTRPLRELLKWPMASGSRLTPHDSRLTTHRLLLDSSTPAKDRGHAGTGVDRAIEMVVPRRRKRSRIRSRSLMSGSKTLTMKQSSPVTRWHSTTSGISRASRAALGGLASAREAGPLAGKDRRRTLLVGDPLPLRPTADGAPFPATFALMPALLPACATAFGLLVPRQKPHAVEVPGIALIVVAVAPHVPGDGGMGRWHLARSITRHP